MINHRMLPWPGAVRSIDMSDVDIFQINTELKVSLCPQTLTIKHASKPDLHSAWRPVSPTHSKSAHITSRLYPIHQLHLQIHFLTCKSSRLFSSCSYFLHKIEGFEQKQIDK